MTFEQIFEAYEKYVYSNINKKILENSPVQIGTYLVNRHEEIQKLVRRQKRKISFWLVMKVWSMVDYSAFFEDVKGRVEHARKHGLFIGYMFGILQNKRTTLEELLFTNKKTYRLTERFIL